MSKAEGQPDFVGRPYKILTCAEGTLKVLILHQLPAPFIGRIVADNQPKPGLEQNVRNIYMSRDTLKDMATIVVSQTIQRRVPVANHPQRV